MSAPPGVDAAAPIGLLADPVARYAAAVARGWAMARTPPTRPTANNGSDDASAMPDQPQLAAALGYRLAVENLLTQLLTRFARLANDSLDEGIRDALGEIGAFLGADRARILVFDEEGASFRHGYDWCASGVEEAPRQSQCPNSEVPWAYAKLAAGEAVCVPQVCRLGAEAAAERAGLQARGVQSVIFQPIVVGERFGGAVQLEWIRSEACWSEDDLRLSGIVAQVIAVAMARKQAQQELRASEEKFRGLVEHINEIIYSLDAGGIITYVSPAVERSGGYKPSEVIGHHFLEFIHLDDQAELLRSYGEVLAGRYAPSEYRIFDKSGEVRWVRSTSRLIREGGEVVGMRAVLMDITERKHIELAVEQGERRWRSLIENSSDGIVLFDVHDIVQYASPGALKVLGISADAMIGRRGADFVHPDDRRPLAEAMAGVITIPGGSFTMKMRLRHRDGSWRWVDSVGTNLLDDPSVKAVIANYHDITDARLAAEEVAILNQTLERRVVERTAELAAANTELESFSYSVSHDLRSPLRSIDAWSQALIDTYHDQLRADGRDMLGRIRRSVKRMGGLIDDLLALSRVNRVRLRRRQVDLSTLARGVVADLRLADRDREVEFVIADGAVAVGDQGLLQVVVENLIGNAWKFSSKCARARIEFGCAPPATVDAVATFFVRDNGAGFDMNRASKLFGPFQRLHALSEFPGNGVGLATVQRIVMRHGGRIWAESAPENGATFYFTLQPGRPGRGRALVSNG